MKDVIHKCLKVLLVIVLALLVFVACVLFIGWPKVDTATQYGITFSRPYAASLGEDPTHVLNVALEEIGIKQFRIPAYWGLLEPSEHGKWDFTQLDADIDAIAKHNGHVTIAIGEKVPRWPECWGPTWWKALPREQQRPLTFEYFKAVVDHYRNNPTVTAWQVENEPYFQYGDCPAPDNNFISLEIPYVKTLDTSRPIYSTDSGELSTWLELGPQVDKLGVSVYRLVRNQLFGNLNITYFFVPPYLYERKAWLVHFFGVKGIYVSEFQMEPWSNTSLDLTPVEQQLASMDIDRMKSNFSFAERMGVSEIDFWGLEWWVWMKDKQNHPEFVQAAKEFWASH